MDTIFEEECGKLEETVLKFQEILDETHLLYSSLPSMYRSDPDLLNDLLLQTHNRMARLTREMHKPYFARIDFSEAETEAKQCCYIGKIGVSDSDNHIVTVDWRAPISTLYYDSSVGPARYEAPGGEILGSLLLKRQFEIEHSKLCAVRDVDTVVNDELLKPYLGVNADNRLKNIVASIQGEQNRIIREKIDRNLFVQGAAGSGKTTVALHRIAYLVYNYRDTIRPRQYMVIGPNSFFISYISSVLPDLDVDSVPQYTFATLAAEYLQEPYTLTDSAETLSKTIEGSYSGTIERFKVSMLFKEALEQFMIRYEQELCPTEGFKLKGFELLPHSILVRAWEDSKTQDTTLATRVEKCILILSAEIGKRRDLLEHALSVYFCKQYADTGNQKDLERMHRDRALIESELEKSCRRPLRELFRKAQKKILPLYQSFLQNAEQFFPLTFEDLDTLKKETLARLRRRILTLEDLPALMYLKYRVFGAPGFKDYRHTVIDEAQDFGTFDFYILRRMMSACTFTIVGDLAQAIYAYRGITCWEDAITQSFEEDALLCEMQKSYRTTVEIMQAANAVTDCLGLCAAVPVIRHGDEVGIHGTEKSRLPALISEKIQEYQALGYVSIVVLTKTAGEAVQLCTELYANGLPIKQVTGDSAHYEGGLCVMTGYLSKGLEFDGVILYDAGDAIYHSENRADMHLLYVAMTRPLHRLDVYYTGRPALPLRNWSALRKD